MRSEVTDVSETVKIDSEHGLCLWWTSRLHGAVLPLHLLLLQDRYPSGRVCPTSTACPRKCKTDSGCCFLPYVSQHPRRRVERPSFKRREGISCLASFYSEQTLWKLFSQPRLRLQSLRFTSWYVLVIVLRSILTSHDLMLVRDSMSQCTSDYTLTVTCYKIVH